MKKYIIIGLIVLTGIALLIMPFFRDEAADDKVPAVFSFTENLALVGNENVELKIDVLREIEKLELFYNDSLFKTWSRPKGMLKLKFSGGNWGVGARTLNLVSTLKDGRTFIDNRMVRILSDIIPEKRTIQTVQSFPHDPNSFTQGLEFYEGRLFEGTGDPGNKGASLVAEVELLSGSHLKKLGLDYGFFGEGITIVNNTLFQLTWKNQKCFTYNIDDNLQLVGEFSYHGEGWGICNDGEALIMSDGTERLLFRDPRTFSTIKTIDVYNNKGPITQLNELEYIDGKIYANVWTTNIVVVIDPITGKVLQEIDGTSFAAVGKGAGDVMNGIAIDKTSGKIYMTGKNWNKLYEVRFVVPEL